MAINVNIPGIGNVQVDNAAQESTLQQLLAATQKAAGVQFRNAKDMAADIRDQASAAKSASAAMASMSAATGGAAASTQGFFSKLTGDLQSTSDSYAGVAAQVQNFGASLANTASDISRIWLRTMGDLSVDPIERGTATISKALGLAQSGLLVFAKGLGSVIPSKLGGAIGKTLGLGVEAAGSLAQQLNELVGSELTATVKTFKQFSDMGATFGGGLADMRTMAYDAGLTLQQFSSVIKAQREEVLSFGGTLADGALKVAKVQNELAANTGKSGRSLQKELLGLGFGIEEQAGIAISLMANLRALSTTSKARSLNEKEVAELTRTYAQDLRLLQEATGQDAKAVMEKARKETMNAALMAKLSVNERLSLQKTFGGMAEMPAEMRQDLQQAIIQELTGGAITNPLVAGNQELLKYVKESAARTRAGGDTVMAEQLKAGRQLAQNVRKQAIAGEGIGVYAAQAVNFSSSVDSFTAKQAAAANALIDMASRTDPEGITQHQRAIEEAGTEQEKLTRSFADLTVEGKRFNTELGHLNTRILPAYAEGISGITAGMRRVLQGAEKIVENPAEGIRQIGGEIWNSMLTELKSISGYLKPGINNLMDTIINWSRGGATNQPARALGGPVASRTSYLVGERGPELFVPGNNGNIIPNNALGPAIQAMQNSLVTSIDAQKKQALEMQRTQNIPVPQTNVNEVIVSMLEGPHGFSKVMSDVQKKLSDDNERSYNALQEQITKLDDLIREMRNNTSANENIASMLS